MSRAVPALVATFVGLVALVSFKSSPGIPKSSTAARTKRSAAVATGPPTTTTPPTTPPTTAPRPPGGGTSPPTTTPPATAPPTTNANAVRTVDGDPFDNDYGTVQVEVTLQGNQITDVTALQMPVDRQRSQEISQQAEPILRQEALQAQSAQIDIVGGASFTSQSYAQSLQSALDKASR